MFVILVQYFVSYALLVVNRHRYGPEGNAPEAVAELENTLHDIVEREVGAKHLLVEVVFLLAYFFRIIPPVPRFEAVVAGFGFFDRFHLFELFFCQLQRWLPQLVEQCIGVFRRLGHFVVECEGAVRGIAHQPGLFEPEFRDLVHDLFVVGAVTAVAAFEVGLVELFAQVPPLGVAQKRNHTRLAERKDPFAFHLAVHRLGAGRRLDRGGHSCQVFLFVDYQRKGVVVGEQVVAELYAESGELLVDLFKLLLLRGREQCPGPHEPLVSLFREP